MIITSGAAGTGAAIPTLAGEPAVVWLGPLSIVPELELEQLYDENLRNTGLLQESSAITRVSPTVTVSARNKLDTYEIDYSPVSSTFHDSPENNHIDHHLSLHTHNEFTDAHRLDLDVDYDRVESVQDTTNLLENDKYNSLEFGGVYGLGSEAALFHMELGLSKERVRYDNQGLLNKDRERDELNRSITGYYGLSSRTHALIEIRQHDYDYLLASSRLNSDSRVYLVGLTWEATSLTKGTVKVGYEEKNFDHESIADQHHDSWEAAVAWEPLPYSTFTLTTQRGIAEGSVSENFIETTEADLNWAHKWSPFVDSEISLTAIDENYNNDVQRRDNTFEVSAEIRYEVRRWITTTIGFTHANRNSNVPVRSYNDNVFAIGLEMSL